MAGAGQRDVPERVIENDVGHADKHVLLDVWIKLSVYFLQDISRGRTAHRLTPQHASADRHDNRRRDAFTRHVRNRDAETRFVDLDVVEVIAAHLPRRNVETADFKTFYNRRFSWKQDPLNVARDFEIVVEPLLLVRFRVNDRIVEREG